VLHSVSKGMSGRGWSPRRKGRWLSPSEAGKHGQ